MNGLGYMVKEGAIDVDAVYDHSGGRLIWLWMKYKPIIMVVREHNAPYAMKWWEYLVGELEKVAAQRGEDLSKIPIDYTQSITEE